MECSLSFFKTDSSHQCSFSFSFLLLLFVHNCSFFLLRFVLSVFLFLCCLMSPLCLSVLKPNFHLCFGQTQHGADLKSLSFGDVLGCLETLFQASTLQLREDWATLRAGGSAHGRGVKGLMGNKI